MKAFKERHARCIMCGENNPWSLGLKFAPDARGAVSARFQAHENLQGYAGILHGGVISGLLDAAMTHCLSHHGVHAVTADLRVRFVKPVPWTESLEVTAWLDDTKPPLYRAGAELRSQGVRMAWAQGKFMPCPEVLP